MSNHCGLSRLRDISALKRLKAQNTIVLSLFGLNRLKRGGQTMRPRGVVFLSRIASKKQSVSYRSIG